MTREAPNALRAAREKIAKVEASLRAADNAIGALAASNQALIARVTASEGVVAAAEAVSRDPRSRGARRALDLALERYRQLRGRPS